MATPLHFPSSVSWLGLIADWTRTRTMNEWVKIGLTISGFAVVTWSMVQQHEYRLEKIEKSFDAHLERHDDQYKEIQKFMRDLEVSIARLGRDGQAVAR